MYEPTTTLYRFFNKSGHLLYVGITSNPSRRLDRHRKEKGWWSDISSIELEHFPDRPAAAQAEVAAIKAEHPEHNVVHSLSPPTPRRRGAQPLWHFHNKEHPTRREGHLWLDWEIDGSAMSDDWTPYEIDAYTLLRKWAERHVGADGTAPIYWFVDGDGNTSFEAAPFQPHNLIDEDFLSFFTWPHNEQDERLNWLTLPVSEMQWNVDHWNKGGFIQEALQWKPAPLQASMNVTDLMGAAGWLWAK